MKTEILRFETTPYGGKEIWSVKADGSIMIKSIVDGIESRWSKWGSFRSIEDLDVKAQAFCENKNGIKL